MPKPAGSKKRAATAKQSSRKRTAEEQQSTDTADELQQRYLALKQLQEQTQQRLYDTASRVVSLKRQCDSSAESIKSMWQLINAVGEYAAALHLPPDVATCFEYLCRRNELPPHGQIGVDPKLSEAHAALFDEPRSAWTVPEAGSSTVIITGAGPVPWRKARKSPESPGKGV